MSTELGPFASEHRASISSGSLFAQPSGWVGVWQQTLPELGAGRLLLRELRPDDAPALLRAMTRSDVSRFISPPPTTLAGFEQFIDWTKAERTAGTSLCYGVVDRGSGFVIGLFQVRLLEATFRVAEWGFALAQEFWGSGVFMESASRLLEFVFGDLGVQRLEARAVVANTRGNGALRKLGAVPKSVLRQSFCRNGEHFDQLLWTLPALDCRRTREPMGAPPLH